MTQRSGATRGVAISVLGNLVVPLAGLITAPVLAQSLGVEGRGIVAAATAPLMLATSIATLGLPEALTYFSARSSPRMRRMTVQAAVGFGIAGLLITCALFAMAPLLSDGDRELATLIGFAGLATTPSLFQSGFRGIAAGRQRWWLITTERLVNSVGRMVVVAGLALAHDLTVASGSIAMAFTTCIGLIVYVRLIGGGSAPKASPNRELEPNQEPERQTLWSFGIRMWFGSLSGILLSRLDQTLLVLLSSATQLGLYAVAVTISEVVLIFNSAVREVIFSVESNHRDETRVASASRISTAATIVGSAAVCAISVWALPVFFGEDFAGALPSVIVLSIAIVLGNPGSVAGAALSARGRPGLRSLSISIAVVINVIALLMLAPAFGSVGAAWATAFGNLVAGSLNIVWLKVYFGVPMSNFLGLRRDDLALLLRVARRR